MILGLMAVSYCKPRLPPQFKADKPFAFVIKNLEKVLFLGRLVM